MEQPKETIVDLKEDNETRQATFSEFDPEQAIEIPRTGVFFKKNDFENKILTLEIKSIEKNSFNDKKFNAVVYIPQLDEEYVYNISNLELAFLIKNFGNIPGKWTGKKVNVHIGSKTIENFKDGSQKTNVRTHFELIK